MAEAASLDAVIQDYIDRDRNAGDNEVTLSLMRHVSSYWLSSNAELNCVYLPSVLLSNFFQQLVSLLVTQHSHLFDDSLRQKLLHGAHSGAYQRFDAAIRLRCPNHDHGQADVAPPASLSPTQLIRLLLETAFDDMPSQPHVEDPPLPANDDYTKMLVQSSFALPFRGPAVELLLAHIQIHELGNRRVAALQKARMDQVQFHEQDVAQLMDVEMRQDDSQAKKSSYTLARAQSAALASTSAFGSQAVLPDQVVVFDQEMQHVAADVY